MLAPVEVVQEDDRRHRSHVFTQPGAVHVRRQLVLAADMLRGHFPNLVATLGDSAEDILACTGFLHQWISPGQGSLNILPRR